MLADTARRSVAEAAAKGGLTVAPVASTPRLLAGKVSAQR
jgi:hypothetical protein